MNDKGYRDWIGGIARRYRQSQIKAATAVNVEMLKFYWSLGADIVRLEKNQPWGSKFMNRISADLKAWMPEAKCFSRVNLYYMVRFFNLYAPAQIVQQVAEQLPLRAFITEFPNVCQMVFSVPWGTSYGTYGEIWRGPADGALLCPQDGRERMEPSHAGEQRRFQVTDADHRRSRGCTDAAHGDCRSTQSEIIRAGMAMNGEC